MKASKNKRGERHAHIIEITDLSAPELDVFARLTEAQLRSRRAPERALFIAESPKVIGHALDAGYEPVSLLMERRQLEGPARDILARCGDVPLYTAGRDTLAALTGYELTRGVLCAMRRPSLPAVEELCAAPGGWPCWRASWTPPTWGPSSARRQPSTWTGCWSLPPAATPSIAGRCGSAWAPCSRSVDLYRGALRRLAPAGTCPSAGPGLSDRRHGPEPRSPLHRGLPAGVRRKAGHRPGHRGRRPFPERWPTATIQFASPWPAAWIPLTWRRPAPWPSGSWAGTNEPEPLEPLCGSRAPSLCVQILLTPPGRRPSSPASPCGR